MFLALTVVLPADALRESVRDGDAPSPPPATAAAAAAAAAGRADCEGRKGGGGGQQGREVPLLLAKWIPLGYDLYVRREGGREGKREGGREEGRE